MRIETLLERIWQEEVETAADRSAERLLAIFNAIVPVRAFVLETDTDTAFLMADDVELMPALPLGDVLAEEMALDVPYGSFLLFRPRGDADPSTRSREAGVLVGEALLHAASNGVVGMERATSAIYVMAHAASRLAATEALLRQGLDASAFCLGLAQALASAWQRDRCGRLGTAPRFDRPDFLWQPQLRTHLRTLDPGFAAPEAVAIPGDLMRVTDGIVGLTEWIARIDAVVLGALGAPVVTPRRVSGFDTINSRFNLQ